MSDNPITEPENKFYNAVTESEPTKPAEEVVVNAEVQAPPEEESLEAPVVDTEETEAKDEDKESQYIDLDGSEIDLEDVRKWRDGHLMQSDYTKKTTTLADERKAFEAERESERENLLKSQSEVSEMRDTLEVLVMEDEAVDWVELKEDDPERYIELKEKADKRKESLEKIKADRATPTDDPALIATEQGKLFAANPAWLDKDKKITEAFTADTKLMNEYAIKAGFDPEEFSQLNKAHYLNSLLKAAKYDQLQEKGRKIKETREKVPVVTKPKAKTNSQPKPSHEVFYGQS